MPRRIQWLQRLEEIWSLADKSNIPEFDREAISELFNLSRASAIELMNKAGARKLGGALVVDRPSLLRYLDSVRQGSDYQYEVQRVNRIADILSESKELFPAKRVVIEVPPDVFTMELDGLPPGVDISRFEIKIGFVNCQDALTKLFQLSQAIANDYTTFEKITEGL